MAAYQASLNAHAALDLLISRAILEGRTGTLKLRIPMTDYAEHFEGPKFTDDAESIAIEIEIKTAWAEPSEDEIEADVELVEGIESEDEFFNNEDDDGEETGSGTDSSGH